MKTFAAILITSVVLLLSSSAVMGSGEGKPAQEALFIVHFKTGPSWKPELPPNEQTGFQGHSANLQRLRKEGRIVFGTRYGELGMIFFKAGDQDMVIKELDEDPGVKADIFEYEVAKMNIFYPWKDGD